MTYFLIAITTLFLSCNDNNERKCEPVQQWTIQNFKIVKLQCPDLVLAFYYSFKIYENDKELGTVFKSDSCKFSWQATNEKFLTLNVCDQSIKEIVSHKMLLDKNKIDSASFYSKELNQTKWLKSKQIEKFVRDWNKSETRGYEEQPFGSAFSYSNSYKYLLTLYYGNHKQQFYCHNYVILDSSNWKYEMSKNSDLKYFSKYWTK